MRNDAVAENGPVGAEGSWCGRRRVRGAVECMDGLVWSQGKAPAGWRTPKATFPWAALLAVLAAALAGCVNPMGADKTTPAEAYQQTHQNPISNRRLNRETL